VHESFAQENRGRRESRVPVAPAASRAKIKKHTSVVTARSTGITRPSLRNGFNGLLRALPRFWKSKFDETVKRDRRNQETLRKLGWRVAIVWECSVKEVGVEAIAKRLEKWLQSSSSFKEISSRSAKAPSRRISKKKT
jgi:hypothetical protein